MVHRRDHLVTVFGGGGFVGRYAAQALYKEGARVRVAQRDPKTAFFLKPLGGLGQTQFVSVDIRDRERVFAAVQGSAAVVNLIGVLKGDFEGLHVDGARNIAEAAAAAGAEALVQVSAIGVDAESEANYGRTKALGEQAVRAAFPSATILRPSIVFGLEDQFINRFARMAQLLPVVPVIKPGVEFQPVWAGDVGKAIAAAAMNPRQHGGQTYELGGPQVLTMRQLIEWILREIGRDRTIVDVPDSVAAGMAKFGGWAPGAPITWDQWLMLQTDKTASPDLPGLREFGITPTPLAAISEGWLSFYRRHGRFATRVSSPY